MFDCYTLYFDCFYDCRYHYPLIGTILVTWNLLRIWDLYSEARCLQIVYPHYTLLYFVAYGRGVAAVLAVGAEEVQAAVPSVLSF